MQKEPKKDRPLSGRSLTHNRTKLHQNSYLVDRVQPALTATPRCCRGRLGVTFGFRLDARGAMPRIDPSPAGSAAAVAAQPQGGDGINDFIQQISERFGRQTFKVPGDKVDL